MPHVKKLFPWHISAGSQLSSSGGRGFWGRKEILKMQKHSECVSEEHLTASGSGDVTQRNGETQEPWVLFQAVGGGNISMAIEVSAYFSPPLNLPVASLHLSLSSLSFASGFLSWSQSPLSSQSPCPTNYSFNPHSSKPFFLSLRLSSIFMPSQFQSAPWFTAPTFKVSLPIAPVSLLPDYLSRVNPFLPSCLTFIFSLFETGGLLLLVAWGRP